MDEKTDFDDRKYLNEELKGMFFNLDLIQSYGSGIRRAKKAMEDNGSQGLLFSLDNDMDGYTAVTASINEEFAAVKAEEDGQWMTTGTKNKNGTEILPEKTATFLMNYTNKKRMTAKGIMSAIVSDSTITIPRIAEETGSSIRAVKRNLKEFQDADILKREGSDTSGQWILS